MHHNQLSGPETQSGLGSEQQDRIREAYTKTLENELVSLAVAPRLQTDASAHSKTGVSYHSKSSSNHSKASIRLSDAGPATEAQHLEFASRLLKLRQSASGV